MADNMDQIEIYIIQESIKDVIAILDSAPMRLDLVPEANAVQLTNRAPIAHLAIERGLKALISEAGGTGDHTHGLHKLFQDLMQCDEKSAEYLAEAFQDAVKFYGYNVNIKGFKQFRSLDDYLSKVGNEKAFELFRYWAIGESSNGESPILFISLPIHRELLQALWCIFLPTLRQTVSGRVEDAVARAMFNGRRLQYRVDDTGKAESVKWYRNWLFREHTTCCNPLEEAVERDFAIKDDDDFVAQILRDAFNDLQQSNDPAVRYYMGTLRYLAKGSQLRNPDAIPVVDWLRPDQTKASVSTPAGTNLGFIEKNPDGGWAIIPTEEGAVAVSDIAKSVADAKNYLVNRLTEQVTVTINGESRQLRVTSTEGFAPFPTSMRTIETGDSENPNPSTPTYGLEFWNSEHGLRRGDEISVSLLSQRANGFGYAIKGIVLTVSEEKVSIAGMLTLPPREAVERDM